MEAFALLWEVKMNPINQWDGFEPDPDDFRLILVWFIVVVVVAIGASLL